jgi:Tol biopolymer transport system component
MSPSGGSVTRIGAGLPGIEPTWSPDGTQLAYAQVTEYCDDDGCYSYATVYVASADGSGVTYLSGGDHPAWKPHP